MDSMDAAAAEAKYKRRDDTSNLLGQKMLQGWTLLAMTCPMAECYTPLVRSKQGETYCVSCEKYFLTEEQAARKKEAEDDKARKKKEEEEEKEKERQQLERDIAAEQQAEEERQRRIAQQFRLEEDAKRAREMQELEQARLARTAPNSQAAAGPAKRKSREADDSDVMTARRQALVAVYQKIDSLASWLTPQDPNERLVSVAKAIHELAQAAKTLE